MMTQTAALILDAYRDLNARKLFWVVLVLSALVVAIVASLGINERGVTILWFQTPISVNTDVVTREEFYKSLFTGFGVSFWLAWAATILALVSTAGIFPDFVAGGSVDLYLSKPISRLRLFLTKYATGLLFVALQVAVFSGACFAVIGLRGGTWEPRVFLAVPLVVCFFSYLFAVSVLLGLVTRSAIAAVLLTILFWFLVWGLDAGQTILLAAENTARRNTEALDTQLQVVEGQIRYFDSRKPATAPAATRPALTTGPTTRPHTSSPANAQIVHLRERREELITERRALSGQTLQVANRLIRAVNSVLPKTRETTDLTARALELPLVPEHDHDRGGREGGRGERSRRRIDPEEFRDAQLAMSYRPATWVLGTSLAFEAVVLTLAAVIFCRRDF